MMYAFAILAAIIIVTVGKNAIRYMMTRSKVGELLYKAKHPRKIMGIITVTLSVMWVFIFAMAIIQKQYNEYLLLYVFWFVWVVDLSFKNTHGLRICENGIQMYQDFISWEEFKSATWEKNRKGNHYFVRLEYIRDMGIEKKLAKYMEVGEEDKKEVEKYLRKHGKNRNQ
ncbi:MAG: hypothetical protein N4A40_12145 [Tissierellales bacterium]|nr:hypothetical protein [Tissierellales bacterium]